MSAAEWVRAARESVEASEYATAPATLVALDALAHVVDLHRQVVRFELADYRHTVCVECATTWPCRTADAIHQAGVR